MNNIKLVFVIGSCIALACSACNNVDTEEKYLVEEHAVLGLALQEQSSDKVVLEVVFRPVDEANLPRILDVRLQYDPRSLTFAGERKGAAVLEAGKDLTVRNEPDQGKLRLVVMGGNHSGLIGAGALVELTFSRNNSASGSVAFEIGHQVAAPASAVRQMTFGPAIAF